MTSFSTGLAVSICLLALLAILLSPVRAMLAHLLATFLSPLIREVLKAAALWGWALVKLVAACHLVIVKNLTTPRKVLVVTLQREEDAGPK